MPAGSIGTYVDAQGRPRSWMDDMLGQRMQAVSADLIGRGWTRGPNGQWIAPGGSMPAATATTTATPTATPVATPTATPVSQATPAAMVGRMAAAPAEITQSPQVSPLMQLFNFPTLRRKKASQGVMGGASGTGGVGQYNENFWNAWRV